MTKIVFRYTNTLLVVFNNRIFLANQGLTNHSERSEDLSSYMRNSRGAVQAQPGRATNTVTSTGNPDEFKIQIFKTTAVDTDHEIQLEFVGVYLLGT